MMWFILNFYRAGKDFEISVVQWFLDIQIELSIKVY